MKRVKNLIVVGKKIECVLGILFLLLPVLNVIAFFLQDIWSHLYYWLYIDTLDGFCLFCGLLAIAGAYLVKDSFRYLFIAANNDEKGKIQFKDDKNSEDSK